MTKLRFPPARLPESAQELRAEVRQFLRDERLAGSFEPKADSWLSGYSPEFTRKLAKRGWVGMTWPRKYGGRERSNLERFVVTEEMVAAGAPVAAHWIADRQSGPLILRLGTERQRREILPAIASGECYFAIGLSEPDTGSDLASVSTTAVRVDGGWSLTGRKIWTSGAHHSHYMITLCRTSPRSEDRHAGLSQVVVDLHAPGVEIRPILILTGEHHFNEVVLDSVFVPDDMVVGEIGNGWAQATSELAFERSGPERVLSTFPLLYELVAELKDIQTEQAAVEVGRLVASLWALRNMSASIAGLLEQGIDPVVEAALVKDLGTRFEQEVASTARLVLAAEPSITSERRYSALLARSILHSPGFTLRGGTNEILRGVVARGLGLR